MVIERVLRRVLIRDSKNDEYRAYLGSLFDESSKLDRLSVQRELLKIAGFKSMEKFVKSVASDTTVVYSSNQGQEELVPNILSNRSKSKVARSSYDLFAVARVTENLIVIGDDKENFLDNSINPLGLRNKVKFIERTKEKDQVEGLSNDEVIAQKLMARGNNRLPKYIISFNEGEILKRSTVELSLLFMYCADKLNVESSLVIPTVSNQQENTPTRETNMRIFNANDVTSYFGKLERKSGQNISVENYEANNGLWRMSTDPQGSLDHLKRHFDEVGNTRKLIICDPEEGKLEHESSLQFIRRVRGLVEPELRANDRILPRETWTNLQHTDFLPGMQVMKTIDGDTQRGFIFYEGEKSSEPYFEFMRRGLDKILGEGWKDAINGKTGLSEANMAGWGHIMEALAYLNSVNKITGIPMYFYTANIIAGHRARAVELEAEAHKAMQLNVDIREHLERVGNVGSIFKDTKIRFGLGVIMALLKLTGYGSESKGQTDQWKSIIEKHPFITKFIVDTTLFLQKHLATKDFTDELMIIRKALGHFVFAAFPMTVAGTGKDAKQYKGIPAVAACVDAAYGLRPDLTPDPAGLIAMVTRAAPIISADKASASMLRKFYGIESYPAGPFGNMMDTDKIIDLWKETKKNRLIIASTSGNHSNLDEIAIAMDHFRTYQKEHEKSPYSLVVFMGEHSDNDIAPVLQNFHENQSEGQIEIFVTKDTPFSEVQQQIKENKGKIILIRTSDKSITGFTRILLEEQGVMAIIKGGEGPLVNPNNGIVTMLVSPTGPNEPGNSAWSALWRGGIFANFTQKLNNFWKQLAQDLKQQADKRGLDFEEIRKDSIALSILGDKPGDNLFDEIDTLFGDTALGREVNENIVRQVMLEGLINVKNGVFAALVYGIAQIMGIKLDTKLFKKIDMFYDEERTRTIQIAGDAFPNEMKRVKIEQPDDDVWAKLYS